MQILVIDDDVHVRELIAEILESEGHVVFQANDGVEGLEATGLRKFDLIVVDLYMPRMDGIEFLMKLKEQGSTPKIITVSGGGDFGRPDLLHVAELLGSTHTLHKPFIPDDLIALVKTAFGKIDPNDSTGDKMA